MTDHQGNGYKSLKDILVRIPKDNKEEVLIDLAGEEIEEQIVIDKPYVRIANGTIRYGLKAYEILEDGFKRGTFRTYSVFVDADHVSFENMKVYNDAGYHDGQAIALMIDGDDFYAKDCMISSYQDTLFLAPLPDKEYEYRGFDGPLKERERMHREAIFEHCLIEGSIDFIFGGGMGYLHDCEIRSRNIQKPINGFVCAPNTPQNEDYGFIFDECRFTCEEGMKDSVYLARPWRNYGKCLIVNSVLGDHIRKEGFHDWDKPDAHETTCFMEYNNCSVSPTDRVSWLKQVSKKDLDYIDSLRRRKDERDL